MIMTWFGWLLLAISAVIGLAAVAIVWLFWYRPTARLVDDLTDTTPRYVFDGPVGPWVLGPDAYWLADQPDEIHPPRATRLSIVGGGS
jgi:hypothetical protein